MRNLAIFSLLPLLCRCQLQSISIQIQSEEIQEIEECEKNAENHPVDPRLAKIACIQAYFLNLGPRNLTASDWDLFDNATKSRFGYLPPSSGFRIRREIRTLSADEWDAYVNVILTMYHEGTVRKFGLLHGSATRRYHKGAAFLPWHRVFLTHFEEEMRKINPNVSLPYWDYTIDNNITQPVESVVWSNCFFGNGKGAVNSGPFKNLYGGLGARLSRDYAKECASKLINKIDMTSLLDYCKFEDITTGPGIYTDNRDNLELLHDGVHDWIGGDMGRVELSAFDPVFYLHHAFIDYIWETFRDHQTKSCGDIDIETDYRQNNNLGQNDSELHGPDDLMWGYSHISNKYGLSRNWTTHFYNYAPQPSCPDNCKGEYLYCDTKADTRYPQGLCMTRTKDACKRKDVRETRSVTENIDVLVPKLPCSAGMRLKGLPGDGRNRETSEKESQRILQKEIARGDDEDKIENNNPGIPDHGTVKSTGPSFARGDDEDKIENNNPGIPDHGTVKSTGPSFGIDILIGIAVGILLML